MRFTSRPSIAVVCLSALVAALLSAGIASADEADASGPFTERTEYSSHRREGTMGPGKADFIQYWSAFNLLEQQQNPYDAQLLHAEQVKAGADSGATISLWNPPWTVLVMTPVLGRSLENSARLWCAVNAGFLLCCACALSKLYRNSRVLPPLLAGALVVSFYPVLESLWWGQTSVMLATSLIAAVWLMGRERYFAAGTLLAVLSCKPHLFLTMGLFFTAWLIQKRCWRLAAGVLCGVASLLLGTEFRWPGALSWWWTSLHGAPVAPGAVSLLEWKTASLAGAIRILLSQHGEVPPAWPMVAVPVAVNCGVAVWLVRHRRPLELARHLPAMQCLSLLGAPYGWRCDQAVLMLVHGAILADADAEWGRVVWAVFGAQALFLVLSIATQSPPHLFFWFPAVSLCLWWIGGQAGPTHRCEDR